MYDPKVGGSYDMILYRENKLVAVLQDVLVINGTQNCIYSDEG